MKVAACCKDMNHNESCPINEGWKDMVKRIILLENHHKLPLSSVAKNTAHVGDVMVIDFPVTNIDKLGEEIRSHSSELLGYSYQYKDKKIINIDHHHNNKDLRKKISATNQAIEYVKKFGPWKDLVYVTHTDADSILSSLIVTGAISPDELFGVSAIAADHNGDENPIADLLMALEEERDYQRSVEALFRLMNGLPQKHEDQILLDKRIRQRQRAKELVLEGVFKNKGNGVYFGCVEMDRKVHGEMLTSLIPDATVVILAVRNGAGRWEISTRAGQQFPEGASLLCAKLPKKSKGRWNAQNTRRSGGWGRNPEIFAQKLVDYIGRFKETSNQNI